MILCICISKTRKRHITKTLLEPNFQIKYNFLSNEDFNKLQNLLQQYTLHSDPRVTERSSICIENTIVNDIIYKYFPNVENPPAYPIEYRKYSTGSEGMSMHKDLQIFKNEHYYEAVLTLENNSDSTFIYTNKSIWLPPNTLVLVKPNTLLHGVSRVNKGYRTILKFIVCSKCKGLENGSFFNELNNCPN